MLTRSLLFRLFAAVVLQVAFFEVASAADTDESSFDPDAYDAAAKRSKSTNKCPPPGKPEPIVWTPGSKLPEVHRYGLLNRSQEESVLKGQLTDAEIARLIALARNTGKDVYLSGALSETNLGLARRAVVTALRALDAQMFRPVARQFGIPEFRALKSASRLIDEGIGDIDLVNALSGLNASELERLKSIFPECFDLDFTGYSGRHYPSAEYLSERLDGPGALVFTKEGVVQRILAKYQY